jgi:alkylation response protein AidB-like acyl-CoA dehydrogenase
MREERSLSPSTEGIAALVADVAQAQGEVAWRAAYHHGFARLRAELDLHPGESSAAATFESAARTARVVAADCLPLGIAVVMHLYPLCALRCVPLPWLSVANFRRAKLLRAIESRSLILANAGSERAAGAHAPVTMLRTREGVRVDGAYDYVSLANVADVVLFSAPCADCTLFCAADLRSESVRIGASRFSDSMRLSDTCSVTFDNHLVPPDRYLVVPGEAALSCMAQYQRSWFQLLLGESYLARIARLRHQWSLPRSTEEIASINELACLRDFASRLLDDAASPSAVEALSRVTAAMKLRISWHASSAAAALRGLDETAATELGYFKRQPTSDERILRSIGAAHSVGSMAGALIGFG